MIDQILEHWRTEGSLFHSEQEWLLDEVDRLNALLKEVKASTPPTYADGEPCSHPGCLNHVTHPCEGCGRTAGRNNPTYAQGQEETETVEEKEFCCPECDSFDVREISYVDDFGSMECKCCGYRGDPGEDFPSRALPIKEGGEHD